MPAKRKPLIRPPDRKSYSAKDIGFSEEHTLFLKKMSKGRFPVKRNVTLTFEREHDWQVEGELTWKGKLEPAEIDKLIEGEEHPSGTIKNLQFPTKEPTFIEEVKRIAVEFRINLESGTSAKDQSKQEILRFLDTLENTSDNLQKILSEGIVDGSYRLSYAEELLLFGTLSMEDDAKGIDHSFIKKLRDDLKVTKDLVDRRRKIFQQEKQVKAQTDVPDLFREGRPSDKSAQYVIGDVIDLFENWDIPVTKSEPVTEDLDLPDDVTEEELALYNELGEGQDELKKSDFFMVLCIIYNSAGKPIKYVHMQWNKYRKNPLGNLPK